MDFELLDNLNPRFPIHDIYIEHQGKFSSPSFGAKMEVKHFRSVGVANSYIRTLMQNPDNNRSNVMKIKILVHEEWVILHIPVVVSMKPFTNMIQVLLLFKLKNSHVTLNEETLRIVAKLNNIVMEVT